MGGLRLALLGLAYAGCELVDIEGSFVASKPGPNGCDAGWSSRNEDETRLDPVFLHSRACV
jgi:hypothetical protein